MAGQAIPVQVYGGLASKNIQRSSTIQSPPPPPPPNDLIDTTNFVIDFAARKSINIGLDPWDVFNVSVQIITPSRYVSITSDFLRCIYSLMGYILSIISDPPVKSRERLFLKDEINTLSKTTYRGENMLVIESHLRQGCRVLLNRQNLLRLQDIQWAIDESIARKSNVVRCTVMEQTDLIASYLSMNVYVEKSACVEEMIAATRNIHNNLHTMNIIPESQCSFINQIKLFANKQLALCWSANVQASSAKKCRSRYKMKHMCIIILFCTICI
ncbi:uncharacterized protein LOC126553818 [Aphis gossypii]|uniref:uncharacterized protein LOC126553818 n=1 Tax=Aphis gossypii TaxID=80765 RepID=UPI0021599533|nr:uncharacterized protein LOC126553818 [Aphis gossypii]